MATEVTYQNVGGRQPGGMEEEVIRATLDTDSSGNATLAGVSLAGDYGAEPVASTGGAAADSASVANKSANALDISVSGAAASTTVTVEVHVVGPHGVS